LKSSGRKAANRRALKPSHFRASERDKSLVAWPRIEECFNTWAQERDTRGRRRSKGARRSGRVHGRAGRSHGRSHGRSQQQRAARVACRVSRRPAVHLLVRHHSTREDRAGQGTPFKYRPAAAAASGKRHTVQASLRLSADCVRSSPAGNVLDTGWRCGQTGPPRPGWQRARRHARPLSRCPPPRSQRRPPSSCCCCAWRAWPSPSAPPPRSPPR